MLIIFLLNFALLLRTLTNADFPDPLGPIIPKISPGSENPEQSLRIWRYVLPPFYTKLEFKDIVYFSVAFSRSFSISSASS